MYLCHIKKQRDMNTEITVKKIKVKKFRHIAHLTILFEERNPKICRDFTIKFSILKWLVEEHESKIFANAEFLKRFLAYCQKYDKMSILTKNICTRHKHLINSFIFNL